MKYREFAEMLGDKCSGFGWDPETNTVTAAEDAHPNARIFHRKGLDHYKLLGIIFNTTTATGSLARSFSQLPPTSDEERELEENFFRTGVQVNPVTYYTKAHTKKLEHPSQTTEAVSNLNDRYSIAACMDTLNALANVTDYQYIKAAKSFVDAEWRIVFLEMRGSSQMAWVQSL
ncbi:hypothetical protein F0562_032271 [Nyssa sinensis]|uniref:Myb/SANT-like domain-containing protein n=1 Tax=Nyssa sinensis TaxID=561372 RepID=A0A5J5APW8_9ASTE|nr:hypothetical protein F0562_032271 [Nyssa sinensis]